MHNKYIMDIIHTSACTLRARSMHIMYIASPTPCIKSIYSMDIPQNESDRILSKHALWIVLEYAYYQLVCIICIIEQQYGTEVDVIASMDMHIMQLLALPVYCNVRCLSSGRIQSGTQKVPSVVSESCRYCHKPTPTTCISGILALQSTDAIPQSARCSC